MKRGISLGRLAEQVLQQKERKQDLLVPAAHCEVTQMGEKAENLPNWRLKVGDLEGTYAISDTAKQQLGQWAGIPAKYIQRMEAHCPSLFAANLNRWLDISGKNQLVRTFKEPGIARAWLSDRYRPLDYAPMLEACIPALDKANALIQSCDVTSEKLYLKALVPDMTETILPPGVVLGEGHNRYYTVTAGLVISNSEVGKGRLSAAFALGTSGCSNLAISSENNFQKTHLGAALHKLLEANNENEQFAQYISRETLEDHARAVFSTIKDVVAAALDGRIFQAEVERLRKLVGLPITTTATKAVDYVVRELQLTDQEGEGILNVLANGSFSDLGLTPWSLSSAITQHSQSTEDYQRATELELAGGQVLEWDWERHALAV